MSDPSPAGDLARALAALADTVVERRRAWDALDSVSGDGDLGSTLSRGFRAVRDQLDELGREDPASALERVARTVTSQMGGTSGPLWGVAFLRAAHAVDSGPAAVIRAAIAGIQEYGGAKPGDKTLLDALVPAAEAFEAASGDFAQRLVAAARAATEGAERTRELDARRGRGSYGGAHSRGGADPGAVAVAVLFNRLAREWGGSPGPEPDVEPPERQATAEDRPGDDGRRKKFVNDPENVVSEAIEGLVAAHPDLLRRGTGGRFVVRADAPARGRVGLVSGGGSGHEPLHAGLVGPGMLSAACPGQVFASPVPDQMLAAAHAVDGGAGVLFLVKNYTGDVMNFKLAAELAAGEGLDVESVLIADDVAIDDESAPGRRGTGLTLLIEKLAGARAEAGGSLADVSGVARRVAAAGRSFGVALTSCAPPGAGPILDLGPDEMEVGVGIHGESGRRRERVRPAREIVELMLDAVLEDLSPPADTELLAFVNGLGATPPIELHLLFGEFSRQLSARGLRIGRSLVGSYVTSLDMAGASLTLLPLDDELIELWDAPVRTAALRWGI